MQNQKPPPQCTVLVACKIRNINRKCLPGPSLWGVRDGDLTAGGSRGRRAVCFHGKIIIRFFLRFMSLINEQIPGEMVYEIQLVFSCVSTCTYTPPHSRDWEMCVVTLLLSWVLQKVQNSPQGWRKAPAVVNRCGETRIMSLEVHVL